MILNIPMWQCSSSFIDLAIKNNRKYRLKLFTNFSKILDKRTEHYNKYVIHILDNSDKKLLYSHLNDVDNSIEIKDDFEWISPYHNLGKTSQICKHNTVIISDVLDKNIINNIKNNHDNVYFTKYINKFYENIKLKKINNESEYYCNLKNSNFFICNGELSYLADAYYNGKKPLIFVDYKDKDSVINSTIADKFNCGTIFNSINYQKYFSNNQDIVSNKRNNLFLHEKINNYFKIQDI